MKKIHFKKNESQTAYSSHSMAARMSLRSCNKFCYYSWSLLLSRIRDVELNVLYLSVFCTWSMCFQIYLNSLFW